MIHKSTTRVIRAPPSVVMELLADVTTVDKWNTHVKSVDLASPDKKQRTGVGAARVCHFHDGTSIKETVTKVDNKHIAMAVSDFSMPLSEISIDFAVRPAAAASSAATDKTSQEANSIKMTELTFSMHYNVKYGPIGYLLGQTVLKMKLHSVQTKILAGIDHHLATGERIGKDFKFSKKKR
jgi:uncharacterized protein YndB with AHSA1/START domain